MKLNEVFKDNMVLQRNEEIAFFGENEKERTVRIEVSGRKVKESSLTKGTFKIIIPAQKTSWKETVSFYEDNELLLELKDVKFGEVWLAGGQSNMELPMTYDHEYKSLKRNKLPEGIFFYEVPKRYAPVMIDSSGLEKQGIWYDCNKGTLALWPAVPFYFAAKLSEKMPDCPIGIVSCNYGGSNMLCWLPEEQIVNDEKLAGFYDAFEQICASVDMEKYKEELLEKANRKKSFLLKAGGEMYMKGRFPSFVSRNLWKNNQKPLESQKDYLPWDAMRPCGLYEYMFRNIEGFVFKGVIWYQGESEARSDRAPLYTYTMQLLVKTWREKLEKELPFITVVLPAFTCDIIDNGVLFPEIRRQQKELPEHIENLYSIEDHESGTPYNIHSPNKKPIGEKLALSALKNVYSGRRD